MFGNRLNVKSILYVIFFLSGATGLVYEVIWVRLTGLIFGNTSQAISTVLGAFMAGLALGSWKVGRKTGRTDHPPPTQRPREGGRRYDGGGAGVYSRDRKHENNIDDRGGQCRDWIVCRVDGGGATNIYRERYPHPAFGRPLPRGEAIQSRGRQARPSDPCGIGIRRDDV